MIKVSSEVGRLRQVVVHPPGRALERMLPAHIDPHSPDYVLFDDLVHLPQAQREHADLRAVLGTVAEVHLFEDMCIQAFGEKLARSQVVDWLSDQGLVADGWLRDMENMTPEAFTQTLIVGTAEGDLDGEALMPPLPNLIFARDLAAVVGDLVVVSNASKRARHRESVLAWALVDHHPLFQDLDISSVARKARGSRPLTIEGGDVLVVSDSLVVIGASERTSWSMIVQLAEEILDRGYSRVMVVEMPKQRSSMHLDTVFTQVSWDRCVVYKPLLEKGSREEASITRLSREGTNGEGRTTVARLPGDLLDALAIEGHPLQATFCGGGHPVHQHREQWTDGANYVALGPGIVVGYARNEHTGAEMERAGFEVMDARNFLQMFKRDFQGDPEALLDSGMQIAVHIKGSELSRGRGGPRCLTLPLERE